MFPDEDKFYPALKTWDLLHTNSFDYYHPIAEREVIIFLYRDALVSFQF